MINPVCPDCKTSLSHSLYSCPCGWRKRLPKSSYQRCIYSYHGQRCPRRGDIGLDRWGTRWYCREHYRSQYDPKKSRELLHAFLAQKMTNKSNQSQQIATKENDNESDE